MKDNKEFIKGVYDKYDEYLKEENSNKKFKQVKSDNVNQIKGQKFLNSKFAKVLSVAAVFTIVISGALVSKNLINKNDEENTIIGKTTTSDKISLKTVNDFETFYNIVKDNTKVSYNRELNQIEDIDDDSDSSEQSTKTAETQGQTTSNNLSDTEDYSKTNIQVENVDEADIVKTNGKYIFYVVSEKVIIVDIQDKTKMEKVAEIEFENDDFSPSELYISENNMVILGNERGYTNNGGKTVKETTTGIYKKRIYKQKAVAIVYDLSTISNPKETRRVEIEGNYVSSRMIDNNIYFVANKSIVTSELIKTKLEDLDEEDFKPTYTDTLKSSKEKIINFDQIYYFDNIETLNYLTLGGFSIDGKNEADVKTFLGAGENIYSSAENMYVIKSKSVYDADTNMSFGRDTKILKFSLNKGKIEFKAEADVEGGINNQFSMDENNGYFRIATTIGKTYNMDKSTSNSLYILDKDLKEVGRLDGIAKGEKIYSVRYAGDKAYVVTFKEIDPLFVIDLSDVKNPKILGKLKIPGYSTYLHPYDETHLIGFGYDTKTNASGTGVQNDGLKMSMFDITDLNNPKEMFSIKIGDNSTSSQLITEHKALLFSKEKNIIAFPVSNFNYSYYSRDYKNAAQIYDIDLNKGFTLRGEIVHETTEKEKRYYSNYKFAINRIIYSNDEFYTLSNSLIKASDMNTLNEINRLDI